MELIKDLFINFLYNENWESILLQNLNFEEIIEKECYKTLNKIVEIIRNDEIEDDDCFNKIEKIVCLFESMGIDCLGRHDFG